MCKTNTIKACPYSFSYTIKESLINDIVTQAFLLFIPRQAIQVWCGVTQRQYSVAWQLTTSTSTWLVAKFPDSGCTQSQGNPVRKSKPATEDKDVARYKAGQVKAHHTCHNILPPTTSTRLRSLRQRLRPWIVRDSHTFYSSRPTGSQDCHCVRLRFVYISNTTKHPASQRSTGWARQSLVTVWHCKPTTALQWVSDCMHWLVTDASLCLWSGGVEQSSSVWLTKFVEKWSQVQITWCHLVFFSVNDMNNPYDPKLRQNFPIFMNNLFTLRRVLTCSKYAPRTTLVKHSKQKLYPLLRIGALAKEAFRSEPSSMIRTSRLSL